MGLKINREKTRVVDLKAEGASLDFLGYTFRYDRDLYGRGTRYLNLCPSAKALGREVAKVREMTASLFGWKPVGALIRDLNRHLRGWANYFGQGYPRQDFRQINPIFRTSRFHFPGISLGRQVSRCRSCQTYQAVGGACTVMVSIR